MWNIIEWLYLHQKGNLAFYDSLTGLYNRNWWDMYAKSKYQCSEIYLTLIDLNNFKLLNDTLGHQAGDESLVFFANMIKKYVPQVEAVRLGGDEFLLITTYNPIVFLQNMEKKETRLNTFSYGISRKSASEDISIVLKNADGKMYRMKAGGR